MTKENWKPGKQPGTVITDSTAGFPKGSDRTDDSYYGGNLICESIGRKQDADLIAAAPDLLESLHDAVLTMTLMGKEVPKQWHHALCKATGFRDKA